MSDRPSEIRAVSNPNRAGTDIITHISDIHLHRIGRDAVEEARREISQRIVEAFMETRMQEVLALIDPKAVATVAALGVGGKVGEALQKSIRKEA